MQISVLNFENSNNVERKFSVITGIIFAALSLLSILLLISDISKFDNSPGYGFFFANIQDLISFWISTILMFATIATFLILRHKLVRNIYQSVYFHFQLVFSIFWTFIFLADLIFTFIAPVRDFNQILLPLILFCILCLVLRKSYLLFAFFKSREYQDRIQKNELWVNLIPYISLFTLVLIPFVVPFVVGLF